jgi:hypothetical protein
MPGAARLRSERSDTLSVLDNYGLSPERIIARFVYELSLRGRRVLFLSNWRFLRGNAANIAN